MENPHVIRMTDLSSILYGTMKSKGIFVIKDSTKKHFKCTLEREFGECLQVFPDESRKLPVFHISYQSFNLQ